MIHTRNAIREGILLVAFMCLSGPIAYSLLTPVGTVMWAISGEWFVSYSNQYDWVLGCTTAGHYTGIAGVSACAFGWGKYRLPLTVRKQDSTE